MGDQDNAASAEDADNAMHIIWVKKDGSLHMTSLDNLEGPAKQRLARRGVFTRVAGTNGKNYILMGTADPERGFAVVDYETICALPWVYGNPSFRDTMKFLISCVGRGSDHVLDDLDLRMFLCAVRAAVVHCEPQYTWNEYSRFEWGGCRDMARPSVL